ncbi:asparagine synthase-related protein [Nonomuraea monospora]
MRADDWFAVLPDSAAADVAVTGLVRSPGVVVALRHPSGRPCLIGVFTAPAPVCVTLGPIQVAVIGHSPVTATDLERRAARLTHHGAAEDVVAGLPGSFHLVTVVDGAPRIRGDAAGLRRVFHTTLDGVTVAADRADVLAAWRGAEVNQDRLVSRLLTFVPPPLSGSMWNGVHAVEPGQAVLLSRDGSVRATRWWQPPEPGLDLGQGAPMVGQAVAEAVACRVRDGRTIAADLSGGLDSTPLCFLAQTALREHTARPPTLLHPGVREGAGRLVTVRSGALDLAHDDERWARQAAALLDGEHLVLAPGELPGRYARVAEPVTGLDEPLGVLSNVADLRTVAERLAAHGASVHLTGHGGDEVTLPPPCYLHDLARRHPLAWWPHLRERRAKSRWPLAASLAALAGHRSYPSWLARQAGLLTAPYPPEHRPDLGWEWPLRLPSWTHPDAAATAARLLRQAAAHAEPLAGTRAQHLTLAAIRDSAADLRLAQRLTARYGAAMQTPYLDTPVIDACLAIRVDHRARPGAYKPLTVAAMAGRVPAQCLSRTTKGEFSFTFFDGLRRHRDQLLALAEGSRLAALGLADPAALRRAVLRTPTTDDPGDDLERFIAMENWLRALPPPPRTRPAQEGPDR